MLVGHGVTTIAARAIISTCTALDKVMTVTTVNFVVTSPCVYRVVAVIAGNFLSFVRTEDLVVTSVPSISVGRSRTTTEIV